MHAMLRKKKSDVHMQLLKHAQLFSMAQVVLQCINTNWNGQNTFKILRQLLDVYPRVAFFSISTSPLCITVVNTISGIIPSCSTNCRARKFQSEIGTLYRENNVFYT